MRRPGNKAKHFDCHIHGDCLSPMTANMDFTFLKLTCRLYPSYIEAVVERLLPLGFTRASILKELYLSDGDPDIAALQLLKQREDNEEQLLDGGGGERSEGTKMEEEEQGQGEEEEEEEKRKLFTIGIIWVGLDTTVA